MRLSSVFIQNEINDETKDVVKLFAQSRPDSLYVYSIKTANSLFTNELGICLIQLLLYQLIKSGSIDPSK